MPRAPRKRSTTGIYHVMIRGVNRQIIFEDREDKKKFLTTLKKVKDLSDCKLFAYCLMDNHVHLLLKESPEMSVSDIMKRTSSRYVVWYNRKYERYGHLFQNRFKSENVETVDYFRTVLRYIHQNPLKAGHVTNVFESKWTSLPEYLSTSYIIDTKPVLKLFENNSTNNSSIQNFKIFMSEQSEEECLDLETKASDEEVKMFLTMKLGIKTSSQLQQMNRNSRDDVLKQLKKLKGVSNGQLARITGISKNIIQRAGK
ncbi:transposase [Bacillus alkalisoli]|uniref:transposase n=1 Tax=Bacillus alkalisoli TaxID=2011008 RepID=UPI000C245DA7|nr:transposase [Bacillus alkalisoli]